MCKFGKAIIFLIALMTINAGIAFGAHWEAGVDQNPALCFEQTEQVANGADPNTLSTVYCTRALRAKTLPREERSAVLFNKGIIQRAQGDLAAAQLSFERAVSLSRTVDRRNLALAEVSLELGDYAVALEQYDLLAASTFALGSEGLRQAVAARREEIQQGPNYFVSFEKAQACAACHGDGGISVIAERPTLAGRSADYLEHALHQYRTGQRQNQVMTSQAMLIAEEDIPVLAEYFAGANVPETTRIE